MNKSLRLAAAALLVLLLNACAGTDAIRGRLHLDLRPEGARTPVVLPPAPDEPRYRYLGELVGEPNFEDVSDKSLNPLVSALKWVAGVFDSKTTFLMQRPHHGAVGEKGRIYVVDAGRNEILVFDPDAQTEDEADRERGGGELMRWEYAAAGKRFESPVAIAPVWGGDLAVSDSRLGMVARLNVRGEPVAALGAGLLQRPTGLAFDAASGRLYVADTVANDIKVFDAAGTLLKTFGAAGEGPGELNAPTHLAFGGGQLYVSDTLNRRIQIFDGEGRYVRHFGEGGLYVGNFTRPKGVAVDPGGIVYVVESYFSHLLAFSGKSELLMGINGSGLRGDAFMLPSGVWTDKEGRVFVADMFNGRIVVFQLIGGAG